MNVVDIKDISSHFFVFHFFVEFKKNLIYGIIPNNSVRNNSRFPVYVHIRERNLRSLSLICPSPPHPFFSFSYVKKSWCSHVQSSKYFLPPPARPPSAGLP